MATLLIHALCTCRYQVSRPKRSLVEVFLHVMAATWIVNAISSVPEKSWTLRSISLSLLRCFPTERFGFISWIVRCMSLITTCWSAICFSQSSSPSNTASTHCTHNYKSCFHTFHSPLLTTGHTFQRFHTKTTCKTCAFIFHS